MWKKILLGFVVFIGLVVALVFWATSGMSGAADDFFNLLAQKNYTSAYQKYLSSDFKSKTSLTKFIDYVKANRFDEVKETQWGNRQIEGNLGELEGSLITKDGSAIPIKLKFVKADDNWQIYAITKPQSGINPSESNAKKSGNSSSKVISMHIPSKEEAVTLLTDTMQHFTYSIKAKNMQEFYESASALWKKHTNVEEMNKAFGSVIDSNIDFTPLIDVKPKIEKINISPKGILDIKATYDGKIVNIDNAVIEVEAAYIQENGKWKLIKFSFYAK